MPNAIISSNALATGALLVAATVVLPAFGNPIRSTFPTL